MPQICVCVYKTSKFSGSDVLTQLASMRKQLQNERKRVENALEHSKVLNTLIL
jgi:hypothetical protein